MKVEQIYTGCLSQGAYYIESNGEVAIIDPLRDTKPYIERAQKDNAKIKYIFETHFHADFVSGHIDLAKQTDAKIIFGPNANTSFTSTSALDNQIFVLGNVSIKVIHTPGHTMESTCFLLLDEQGKEYALFSGDTLFIGDVGRPDLAVKSNMSKEELASHLFYSLRNKIMTLPDETIIYPAHGAGSACGKNLSKNTFDTLGNQKIENYALRFDMSKEQFLNEVLEGLQEAPSYFSENVRLNKSGYESLDDILKRGDTELSVQAFESLANTYKCLILDTRAPQVFKNAFIPNSINIGLEGAFAPWVGALIPNLQQEILLIVDEGKEQEVITRLARVGYDHTLGYLSGGIDAWINAGKEVDSIKSITAHDLEQIIEENIDVLDVRKPSEYEAEHIKGVRNFPLATINESFSVLDKTKEYHIHCGGGYRSMIMASILKSRGFESIIDIQGGFEAIKKTTIPLSNFVCSSKK